MVIHYSSNRKLMMGSRLEKEGDGRRKLPVTHIKEFGLSSPGHRREGGDLCFRRIALAQVRVSGWVEDKVSS